MSDRYRTIVADPPWHYESWPTSPARISHVDLTADVVDLGDE